MFVPLQMSHRSSKGKEIVFDVSSSPVAKQTRLSSQSFKDSNHERFKTSLDSQTHSIRFDTLGTTFIPRIFEAKDWANLFGNFEDSMEKLVRERKMMGKRKRVFHQFELHS